MFYDNCQSASYSLQNDVTSMLMLNQQENNHGLVRQARLNHSSEPAPAFSICPHRIFRKSSSSISKSHIQSESRLCNERKKEALSKPCWPYNLVIELHFAVHILEAGWN